MSRNSKKETFARVKELDSENLLGMAEEGVGEQDIYSGYTESDMLNRIFNYEKEHTLKSKKKSEKKSPVSHKEERDEIKIVQVPTEENAQLIEKMRNLSIHHPQYKRIKKYLTDKNIIG